MKLLNFIFINKLIAQSNIFTHNVGYFTDISDSDNAVSLQDPLRVDIHE